MKTPTDPPHKGRGKNKKSKAEPQPATNDPGPDQPTGPADEPNPTGASASASASDTGSGPEDALRHLAALALEHNRQRYPNVPEHARPKPKYSDRTANGLTRCIIDYLRFNGHYATRIQSQGQYSPKLDKWVKGKTTKGTADIHAIAHGRHLSIEVKIGRDRQSDHQKEAQRQIENAGGMYFVARDFQSFVDWLHAIKTDGHK